MAKAMAVAMLLAGLASTFVPTARAQFMEELGGGSAWHGGSLAPRTVTLSVPDLNPGSELHETISRLAGVVSAHPGGGLTHAVSQDKPSFFASVTRTISAEYSPQGTLQALALMRDGVTSTDHVRIPFAESREKAIGTLTGRVSGSFGARVSIAQTRRANESALNEARYWLNALQSDRVEKRVDTRR